MANKLLAYRKIANLAVRALELDLLRIPGTSYDFHSGRVLTYTLTLSPSIVSRLYTCVLRVPPGKGLPEMFVMNPDLTKISNGRRLPHIYSHKGQGIKLCLWNPKYREWDYSMKLIETYIPWTVEWLWYFEDWLITDKWAGGGEHPTPTSSRQERRLKEADRTYEKSF